jgi:hypothetical protein
MLINRNGIRPCRKETPQAWTQQSNHKHREAATSWETWRVKMRFPYVPFVLVVRLVLEDILQTAKGKAAPARKGQNTSRFQLRMKKDTREPFAAAGRRVAGPHRICGTLQTWPPVTSRGSDPETSKMQAYEKHSEMRPTTALIACAAAAAAAAHTSITMFSSQQPSRLHTESRKGSPNVRRVSGAHVLRCGVESAHQRLAFARAARADEHAVLLLSPAQQNTTQPIAVMSSVCRWYAPVLVGCACRLRVFPSVGQDSHHQVLRQDQHNENAISSFATYQHKYDAQNVEQQTVVRVCKQEPWTTRGTAQQVQNTLFKMSKIDEGCVTDRAAIAWAAPAGTRSWEPRTRCSGWSRCTAASEHKQEEMRNK